MCLWRQRWMCYPLSILDDHSRYVVGPLHCGPSQPRKFIRVWRTFERHGVPEAMLMDQRVVGDEKRIWVDVVIGADDRARTGLHYGRCIIRKRRGSGEIPSHPGRSAALSRKPRRLAEWPGALEELRRIYNEHRPHGSVGDEKTDGTLSSERTKLPGATEAVGISAGERAKAEREGCAGLGRAAMVCVRSAGGTTGSRGGNRRIAAG